MQVLGTLATRPAKGRPRRRRRTITKASRGTIAEAGKSSVGKMITTLNDEKIEGGESSMDVRRIGKPRVHVFVEGIRKRNEYHC